MTIKRTREIFGKQMENWTDVQVLDFIQKQKVIVDEIFKMAIKEIKYTKNKQK